MIQTIIGQGEEQPFLIPIGERAEAILEAYDDRQVETQAALRQLESLLNEYLQSRKEFEKSGFDMNTFTILWILKQAEAREPEKAAPLIDAALRQSPNHAFNAAERRRLKAELYKILLPAVGKDQMVELAERILKLPIK